MSKRNRIHNPIQQERRAQNGLQFKICKVYSYPQLATRSYKSWKFYCQPLVCDREHGYYPMYPAMERDHHVGRRPTESYFPLSSGTHRNRIVSSHQCTT